MPTNATMHKLWYVLMVLMVAGFIGYTPIGLFFFVLIMLVCLGGILGLYA